MSRTQELATALKMIRAQGLLEPVLDYLNNEIGRLGKPIKPEGAEWPIKRAFQDGGVDVLEKVIKHLETKSRPSPDGAENTED